MDDRRDPLDKQLQAPIHAQDLPGKDARQEDQQLVAQEPQRLPVKRLPGTHEPVNHLADQEEHLPPLAGNRQDAQTSPIHHSPEARHQRDAVDPTSGSEPGMRDDGFEEGRKFSEEELERYFAEAEEEPATQPFFASPAVRRVVVAVIALVMLVQVVAWLPSIYSLDAIRFLQVSAELSRSPDIQLYKQAVAIVRTKDGKGTGFVVDQGGWVITNRHVVGDDPTPVVAVNGERYVAQVVAASEEVDLALLAIDAQDLPALSLADRYDGEPGVPFYVIGNPLFFSGIANAGETLGLIGHARAPAMALQAPIYRGNSGSPIIREDGQVIGVVYAMRSVQVNQRKMKIGLAIPVQWVHQLMEDAGVWTEAARADVE